LVEEYPISTVVSDHCWAIYDVVRMDVYEQYI
jgi:hypothetical protein